MFYEADLYNCYEDSVFVCYKALLFVIKQGFIWAKDSFWNITVFNECDSTMITKSIFGEEKN